MPDPSRSDMQLYERAARNGWDVPAATRIAVVRMLGEIVGDAKRGAATGRRRRGALAGEPGGAGRDPAGGVAALRGPGASGGGVGGGRRRCRTGTS